MFLQKISRCFEIFQTNGLRGLFVLSGHGVSPALAGFRKDARPSRRGRLCSAPILARLATFGGETPCPLESPRLFSKLARAGETSEGQNGAKFPRRGNFASSKSRWSGKCGISLVAVIIIMLIVSALALIVASFMSSGNISAITDMQAEQAFYIAQAGLEWYLEQLDGNNNWKSPPAVKTNQTFGPGTFSISYNNADTKDIDVTSTGKVTGWDGNTVQRVVACHVNSQGQLITTSLWQETL